MELDLILKYVGALVLQHAGDCWLWKFGVGDVPGKIVKEDVLACAWQSIRETRLSLGILDFVLNRTKQRDRG